MDSKWFFGDDPSALGEYAWFKDNSDLKSHPVGQKKPNPFGIYDIYGNVFERVSDKYGKHFYSKSPEADPTGPSQGTKSSFHYKIPKVPKQGLYSLVADVVTANDKQRLNVAVNGEKDHQARLLELPFTNGGWQSAPADTKLTIPLNEGENTIRFWRDNPPQYGVAIRSFTLRPE